MVMRSADKRIGNGKNNEPAPIDVCAYA